MRTERRKDAAVAEAAAAALLALGDAQREDWWDAAAVHGPWADNAVWPPHLTAGDECDMRPWDLIQDVRVAAHLRQYVKKEMRTHVCAICGCFQSAAELYGDEALSIQLNRKNLDKLYEVVKVEGPTLGRTCWSHNGRVYNLQEGVDPHFLGKLDQAIREQKAPEVPQERAIVTDVDTGEIHMTACKTCWRAVDRGAVPPWALAKVDTGMIPKELPILTELECICLSPLRAFR